MKILSMNDLGIQLRTLNSFRVAEVSDLPCDVCGAQGINISVGEFCVPYWDEMHITPGQKRPREFLPDEYIEYIQFHETLCPTHFVSKYRWDDFVAEGVIYASAIATFLYEVGGRELSFEFVKGGKEMFYPLGGNWMWICSICGAIISLNATATSWGGVEVLEEWELRAKRDHARWHDE